MDNIARTAPIRIQQERVLAEQKRSFLPLLLLAIEISKAGCDLALGTQALKRIGKPEDVADVIAFWASDAARWITGASVGRAAPIV